MLFRSLASAPSPQQTRSSRAKRRARTINKLLSLSLSFARSQTRSPIPYCRPRTRSLRHYLCKHPLLLNQDGLLDVQCPPSQPHRPAAKDDAGLVLLHHGVAKDLDALAVGRATGRVVSDDPRLLLLNRLLLVPHSTPCTTWAISGLIPV